MFTKRSSDTAGIDEQIRRLHATNDDWFDGSIDSIDSRTAQTRRVVSSLRGRAAAAGAGEDSVIALAAMERSLTELAEMREAMFTADTPVAPARHQDPAEYARLPQAARMFVAAQAGQFLADNADAAGDLSEITVRADNYARHHLSGMGLSQKDREVAAEAFVAEVASGSSHQAARNRRTAAASQPRQRNLDALADEFLFD